MKELSVLDEAEHDDESLDNEDGGSFKAVGLTDSERRMKVQRQHVFSSLRADITPSMDKIAQELLRANSRVERALDELMNSAEKYSVSVNETAAGELLTMSGTLTALHDSLSIIKASVSDN